MNFENEASGVYPLHNTTETFLFKTPTANF